MLTTSYITNRLADLATEREVTIRYANESGSRAWGLASTDSDYDVRFVYQHPKEWYLRLDRPKDMIGPVMELGGELDLVGWDIRKVLFHLAQSNAGVTEWLYSPTVYVPDDAFREQLRDLAKSYFQPKKVTAHYLGVGRSAVLAGYDDAAGDWNLKKFFYYLRPLLAAAYVADEQKAPPVIFTELLGRVPDRTVRKLIEKLIAHKETVSENYRMVVPAELWNFTLKLREETESRVVALPKLVVDRSEADVVFRGLIGY